MTMIQTSCRCMLRRWSDDEDICRMMLIVWTNLTHYDAFWDDDDICGTLVLIMMILHDHWPRTSLRCLLRWWRWWWCHGEDDEEEDENDHAPHYDACWERTSRKIFSHIGGSGAPRTCRHKTWLVATKQKQLFSWQGQRHICNYRYLVWYKLLVCILLTLNKSTQLSGPLNVHYEFYIITKDTFCELTECELSAPCHRCNSCHTDHNDVPPD